MNYKNMSKIRINKLKVKNYRSFWDEQTFEFPDENYQKPVAIIWYNNAGKTNLMNAIKYGLYESVREDTFELKDFHNLDWVNSPYFKAMITFDIWSWLKIWANESYIESDGEWINGSKDDFRFWVDSKTYNMKWTIKQNAPIFYINFHKIKDEISTKKTSWGNLNSFLAKHIDKLIKTDSLMQSRKDIFKTDIEVAKHKVLEWWDGAGSRLSQFIDAIDKNYRDNLRWTNCTVDFWLPDYEDIFLQMMFKIWLNGDNRNFIPIDHFGDGYISMFVMAVIQAIAETNTNDECLFLFEEPESFLHENHQEYFYKMVLCKLAKKHQVIYTTHSDKMIDFFDTKGIIRLEFDEEKKQTEKRYNNIDEPASEEYEAYNDYIQRIEPNLNKILFSRKVILVEWPNDVLVYKYAIEQKVKEKIANREDIEDKELYSQTYLNFENVVIIPHHGKTTAYVLIELCEHFWVDFFVITDLDFEDGSLIEKLKAYISEDGMKDWIEYTRESSSTKKWEITKNWKLLNAAWENIHFNVPKLEKVIWYVNEDGNPIVDKDSMWIWEAMKALDTIPQELFPKALEIFLDLDKLENSSE